MRWQEIFESLAVKAATDDIYEVMDASFEYGRAIGPKTVPITKLRGGVALDNPHEKTRVEALKRAISGPDGYISRLIVDTDGNVIEGQHRLEALRQLGVKQVPVYLIQDLAANVDIPKLSEIAMQAQSMHREQARQLIRDLLGRIAEEGSAQKVMDEYEAPQGYQKAWDAILSALN